MKLKHCGFTVVELLIVIVVIGILFAGATTVYTGIQNDTEATGFARHIENLRESIIFANLQGDGESWWDEATLADCSSGVATEDPYIDEIAQGCEEFQGILADGGSMKLRNSTIRFKYDNDVDDVLGSVKECGNSDTSINIVADLSLGNVFTDEFLARVDQIMDNDDGNDCGNFRWDVASSSVIYKMSVDQNSLQ